MWPTNWFEHPTLAAVGAAMLGAGLLLGREWASGGVALVLWGSGILSGAITNYMPDSWRSGGWAFTVVLLFAAMAVSLAAVSQ